MVNMTPHMWATIAVIFIVTYTLRGSSFALRKKASEDGIVHDLGLLMPAGVMVILILYSLHGVWERSITAAIIGLVATIILHLWKSSALISITGGVIIYGGVLALVTS